MRDRVSDEPVMYVGAGNGVVVGFDRIQTRLGCRVHLWLKVHPRWKFERENRFFQRARAFDAEKNPLWDAS